MRAIILAILLSACASVDPTEPATPWGAADLCKREPEHERCISQP